MKLKNQIYFRNNSYIQLFLKFYLSYFLFEIDKVITVVIIQIVPISSGKPKVTFNHKTDKIVADNGSIQYIKRNEYNNLEFAKTFYKTNTANV